MEATAKSPALEPAFRAWWREPRLTGWFFALSAGLLALRKPWALYAPQFWAEDGSIFFSQNDQKGVRAFLEPYQGYLNFFPRLVAWIASHIADVAWAPAIYNAAAFLGLMAVFVRLASPRLDLPQKPWLVLALFVVAQSGETHLILTHIPWIVA